MAAGCNEPLTGHSSQLSATELEGTSDRHTPRRPRPAVVTGHSLRAWSLEDRPSLLAGRTAEGRPETPASAPVPPLLMGVLAAEQVHAPAAQLPAGLPGGKMQRKAFPEAPGKVFIIHPSQHRTARLPLANLHVDCQLTRKRQTMKSSIS